VERVYLIEVTDTEWYTLNLESVFLLDRATRKLSRCEVQRADDATDTTDNVLRITCAALRGRARGLPGQGAPPCAPRRCPRQQ